MLALKQLEVESAVSDDTTLFNCVLIDCSCPNRD
jgi:hypothetical protein